MTLKDIDLSKLTTKQGIKVTGEAFMDHSGWSVSGAGNVNNDSYSDFIIGAYDASPLGRINAGETYLLFGKKSGLTNIDLKNLTLTQGIKIIGATQNDNSGWSVSGAGDVNGDGYGDVIIAATKKSYLIFGKNTNFTNIDLGTLTLSQGITIRGSNIKNNSDWAVSTAGDVNNDGYSDLIVGSHHENPLGRIAAGETYLIFGKKSLTDIDLVTLSYPQGIIIQGANTNDESGWSVSSAGDVNNDGYDDIIIGARYANPLGRTNAGESYLIFGKNNGFANIDLSTLSLPQGVKIIGANNGDNSGWAVGGAGDVNNDGYDDIIIGARYADPLGRINAGESYLIFGKNTTLFTNIDLKNLTLTQGIKILGADINDNSGNSVSAAGDVNKDGYDDIIIGASGAPKGTFKGETYIIFGKNGTLFTDIDLKNLTLTQGIKIVGAHINDTSGSSVSSAGDINNDGYDDMIIGAPSATSLERYEVGTSYMIFGDETNVPPTPPIPPTPTPNTSNWIEYVAIGASIFGIIVCGSLMFCAYKHIKHNTLDNNYYSRTLNDDDSDDNSGTQDTESTELKRTKEEWYDIDLNECDKMTCEELPPSELDRYVAIEDNEDIDSTFQKRLMILDRQSILLDEQYTLMEKRYPIGINSPNNKTETIEDFAIDQ